MKKGVFQRFCKCGLGFALSAAMAVTAVPFPGVLAAGEYVLADEMARAGKSSILVEMERGLVADFTGTTFNGDNAVTVTQDMNLFQDNFRAANAIKISVKFKLASDAAEFTGLIDILNSKNNKESLSLIVNKNGRVYLMTGSYANGSNVAHTFSSVADGKFHALDVTVTKDNVTFELDGAKSVVEVRNEQGRPTKDFLTALFGGTASGFTDWRGNVDAVTVGGFHENTYQNSAEWKGLKGEIQQVSVGKCVLSVPTGDAFYDAMFGVEVNDNSWLFGGGAETQGRFAEIGGLRNYIGHFEEYVRSTKATSNTTGRQRCTVNAGIAGRDAAGFAEALPGLIERSRPKAVAYLVGPEDYAAGADGIGTFKESVRSILNEALAMKENKGCAVLQLPHAVKDQAAAANAALYAKAAKEVYQQVAGEDSSKAERMVMVDHLSQTDNDDFKNHKLTEEGLLNAEGQYEIAKQLSQATYGSLDGFPAISGNWTVQEQPETYLTAMPEVTAYGNLLGVTMPEAQADAEWKYVLTVDGTDITGTASGSSFVIPSLPAGAAYRLVVRTKDERTQYAPVEGRLTDGEKGTAPQAKGEIQKEIRAKVEDKSKPLTWVFMGDSITHSAVHTHGYDGIAQLFEKYVKEDLRRTEDIVVNTAVSGGTVPNSMDYIEERMSKYKPDIVSVMLGTNDARNRDGRNEKANFKENLKSLAVKIREVNPEAIIIFRSPTQGVGNWILDPVMITAMKEAAEEAGNILYIDQYEEWKEAFAAYPYLSKSDYYLGDNAVHPGAEGHVWMTEKFIRECGLDMNTKIADFSYVLPYAAETGEAVPELVIGEEGDSVTVSRTALQKQFTGGNIGDVKLVLTDEAGRIYEKQGTLSDDTVTVDGLPGGIYTGTAVLNIKGNTARKVTLAEQELVLEQAGEMNREEVWQAAELILAIGTVDAGEACGARIQAAQAAYRKLTQGQKESFSQSLKDQLENAKTRYQKLRQEETDRKAADGAVALINKIGEVHFDSASKAKIEEAEAAYGRLTEAQKALVDGAAVRKLTEARKRYDSLEQADRDQGANRQEEVKAFTAGNYKYQVTDASARTVEVTGSVKKKAAIAIPGEVTFGGKTYTVTSIGTGAFKNDKKVTKLTVGKNVQTIGSGAFSGCAKLKTASLNSAKLTAIGKKAFFNCKALKKLTIKSKKLKSAGSSAFKGIYKKAVIKVPASKVKAYKKLLNKKGQSKTVKITK